MRTNTAWAFTGNAVYAACQWIVFVLLVKRLRPVDAGQFAYAIAVTGPIFVLANVRLRNLLATGVAAPNDFADYLAARLLTTVAAVGGALLIGALATSGPHALGVVVLVAVAKAFDAISDICHGLFQRDLDMRRAAIGLMTNGVISVALVAASLALVPSLLAATAAYAAGSAAALLGWDLRCVRGRASLRGVAQNPAASLACLRRLIWQAAPLGLSSAIGSMQANLPRYVIAAYLGPAALAVFTALAYITTLGNMIVNATAQAALPVLARDFQGYVQRYTWRLTRLVVWGTSLGVASVVCGAVAGRPLLTWIYSVEYASHAHVLIWLMIASAVSYAFLFLGTGTTARMRFGAQLLISCAALTVVACSAGPLVARYGLVGGAYSLLAGAAVEGIAYTLLTLHDLKFQGSRRPPMPEPALDGVRS